MRCGCPPPLAAQLGVDVGDTVELAHPHGAWAVAGIGRVDADFEKRMMIVPDLPTEQFVDGALDAVTLIDLPGDASDSDVVSVAASPANDR